MKIDLASYLKKYWLVLVLTGVISAVIALGITYFMSPAYESTTTVVVMPKNESIASGAMVNPTGVFFGTQADMMVSRDVLASTVESLGLDEAMAEKTFLGQIRDAFWGVVMWLRFGSAQEMSDADSAIMALEKRVEAEVMEDSGVVAITATWSDPAVAKLVADEVAAQFVKASRDLESGSTAATLEEIALGFTEREDAIATASEQLAAYKEANDIAADYDPVGPSGLEADVRAELNKLEARLSAAEGDYDYWRNLYQGTMAEGITDGNDTQVLGAATVVAYPAGPDRLLYAAVGFLVGLLFGLAIATWMELSNRTVYTADDVNNVVGEDVDVVVVGSTDDGSDDA